MPIYTIIMPISTIYIYKTIVVWEAQYSDDPDWFVGNFATKETARAVALVSRFYSDVVILRDDNWQESHV